MVSKQLEAYRKATKQNERKSKSSNSKSSSSGSSSQSNFVKTFQPTTDIGKAQKAMAEKLLAQERSGELARRRASASSAKRQRQQSMQSYTVTRPSGQQVVRQSFVVNGVRTVRDIDPRTRQIISTRREKGRSVTITPNQKIREYNAAVKRIKLSNQKERKKILGKWKEYTKNDANAGALMNRLKEEAAYAKRLMGIKGPVDTTVEKVLKKAGINLGNIRSGTEQYKLEKFVKQLGGMPYSSSVKSKIRSLLIGEITGPSIPSFSIGGQKVYPKSRAEYDFLKRLKGVIERDDKLKGSFNARLMALGLNIKDADKWYTKALKGTGTVGVGFVFTGNFLANAVDKAIVTNTNLFTKENLKGTVLAPLAPKSKIGNIPALARKERQRALETIPAAVGQSFDPTKPENWANIVFVLGGVRAMGKGFRNVGSKANPKFVPSVRNLGTVEEGLLTAEKSIPVIRKLAKASIKEGVNVARNKLLLLKLNSLTKVLGKSKSIIKRIRKDPYTLKLEDMNPLTKTADLIKNIGKEKDIFHATSASPKQLFGQKYSVLKSQKEIMKAVQKATKAGRGSLEVKGIPQKLLIEFVRRRRGVISGGKAQNTLVKSFLKRKTQDFDILIKNHSKAASDFVKVLKKKLPNAKIELKVMKIPGKGFKVYRVKVNGKDLVDFDPMPKDLGRPVRVGKDLVASAEYLARRKASTLPDVARASRWGKDRGDLRRLTGKLFSNKAFAKKVQDPKNIFTVRPMPKGMGASRIKFGETQLFYDLSVPTGYAYNGLAKSIIPKYLQTLAKKVGFKAEFIKKMDSLKYVKSNARFTVLKMRSSISRFPPELAKRIKLASKGKLSAKASTKLRIDINTYINKNPNKVFVGSRTGSMSMGERELVSSVPSQLKLGVKKYGIDPQTKVLFDVIEVSFKGSNKAAVPKSILRQFFGEIRKSPKDFLVRRFNNKDLTRVRRFNSVMKNTDKLLVKAKRLGNVTPLQGLYESLGLAGKNFISVLRALKNKRIRDALIRGVKKVVKKKIVEVDKVIASKIKGGSKRVEGGSVRGRRLVNGRYVPVKNKLAKANTVNSRRKSTKRTERKVAVPIVRSSVRLGKNARRKLALRTRRSTRRVTRPKSRVVKRTTPRSRKRVTPRRTPRVTNRPRTPTRPRPRTPVRPRPRVTTRPRVRPRPRPITRHRPPVRIPKKFRIKITTDNQKKELLKWFKRQEMKYRPSLASILYGITGYKIPKSLTGLEIRPIIIKKRSISKRTVRKRRK